jgi:hypothetical protein
MTEKSLSPLERFLYTLNIVHREGQHLAYSWKHLYSQDIDSGWVEELQLAPKRAEQMEAFISRFGRMQDTIAGKLLPRWLISLEEKPGSQIEILNRAERLGVVNDVDRWLEARQLRNRMIHEYMEDAAQFAEALILAKEYTSLLIETYNKVRSFAESRMGNVVREELPDNLELGNQ